MTERRPARWQREGFVQDVRSSSEYIFVRRVEHEAPTTPQETYARFLSACHSNIGVLTLLTLKSTDPNGKTPTMLAHEMYETDDVDTFERFAQSVRISLERLTQTGLAKQDTYHSTRANRNATLYSLTSLGEQLQAPAFFLLSSFDLINVRHGTDLDLTAILAGSDRGQPRNNESFRSIPITRHAPYLRFRMLEELAQLREKETLSREELARKIDVTGTAAGKIRDALQEAGLLTTSLDTQTAQVIHRFTRKGNLPSISTVKSVASDVYELFLDYAQSMLAQNPEHDFDRHSATEALYPLYTAGRNNGGRAAVSKLEFAHTLSRIFADYTREGYFDKHVPSVSLTPLGKEIITVLERLKRDVANPSFTLSLKTAFEPFFREYVNQNAQATLDKQELHGRKEEHMLKILQLLFENPQGLQSRDITKAIAMKTAMYLLALHRAGFVEQQWSSSVAMLWKRAKRGRFSTYTLAPKTQTILTQHPGISYEELEILLKETQSVEP